ncbi:hypothetical protein [Roseovarius sp. 217]|uniref:hypothetical protein n=1 Tax=Roseovarius sp. (strain 217) TaxID=314264 RepID=UPI0000686531|nr:hypothetical protein [Roseovarius sp. 217]EAQ23965.1 hypothetical protein ROS217_15560 [Roseovarius sp. 217]
MKPNFALSLSFEGIGLLHRAGSAGWHLVGEVALDAEDLPGELASLRAKATLLDPSGLASKLIIPDEQIKYLDLPAASAPDGNYDLAAAEALEGATPYHIDDLVYDWSVENGRLYIAAIASETLDEAEAFAVEHRFNPVSFVARPQSDRFAGEPFFGAAAQARGVDRDEAPVRIIGSARLPDVTPPAETAPVVVPSPAAAQASKIEAARLPDEAKAPGETPKTALPPAPPKAPEEAAAKAASAPAAPAVKSADSPALSFSSIRAERAAPVEGAPKLDGAARLTPLSDRAPTPELPRPGAAPLLTGGADPTLTDMAAASLAPKAAKEAGLSGLLARRDKASIEPAPGSSSGPTPDDEAQRMTIFGARSQPVTRGKPRFLGLILTAVLLLFLVGVAAWSTIFSQDGVSGLFGRSEPEIAVTPAYDLEPDVETESDPDPSSPTDSDVVLTPPPAQDAPVQDTGADPTVAAPEVVAAAPETPQELTPEQALTRYAATGIWQLAPDAPAQAETTDVGEFYLTSIDEAVNFQDAVALPSAPDVEADQRPETPASPAPPGTEFTLDARGFVQATPEGALTPDGVTVRAGPPPVRPPETPTRALPVPGLEQSAESAAEAARLGGIRPRTRPENLIEQQERGALSGLTRSELAALRPRNRPQSVIEAAAAAAAPPPAPEVQPATVSSASLAAALIEANRGAVAGTESLPQAVGVSIKPKLRPQDLERAARAPAQGQATPGEDEEPEVQTAAAARVAPNIPTSASVARSATETNAINLRNVNLIGVYGSPQSRRALVRLSNGRYQKVQVGDRLDGGQVSAIGDTELRYNKRGRDVVLRMPKG